MDIKKLIKSSNLVEDLEDEELVSSIGRQVVEEYKKDLESRSDWEERMANALELALQVQEEKSFPWPGASNVKFPLITIAALQYHARAYPSLINGTDVVKSRVIGTDPDGQKRARAERISMHMSYQILEEDENWEEQMDRTLITQPIIGCAFKKSYFDPNKGHNISEHILAKNLVVPYFAKSLETASRITHVLEFSKNDIQSRINRGIFSDLELTSPKSLLHKDEFQEAHDNAHGLKEPGDTVNLVESNDQVFTFLEQHRYLDLDEDGYLEPYIVTVREDTEQVYRIVARYFEDSITKNKKGDILNIEPIHHFTKYPFIPSPDGGFYDLGFGVLLGPLNESINTLLNQLIDAGTMSTTAGGFLGRGVKIRGGDSSFKPMEWKRIDSTGDDLRKNIFPLPVREPSQVLFTLLELLINYGERIAGATDVMVGINPGQNTPAETSRNAVEQGMKVFNGIFKRTYRSLKEEFRKLYKLNQLFLPENTSFMDLNKGSQVGISYKDYLESSKTVRPAADPEMISDSQRINQANSLLGISKAIPGFNLYEVGKRYLEAHKIRDIQVLFPDPKGPNAVPPPQNPKVQIEQMKTQVKMQEMQMQVKQAQMELMNEVELTQAKIMKLRAEAIKALADAQGVESGHQIALIEAQIGAAKAHQDGLLKQIQIMQKAMEKGGSGNESSGMGKLETGPGNQGGMAGPQGPSPAGPGGMG